MTRTTTTTLETRQVGDERLGLLDVDRDVAREPDPQARARSARGAGPRGRLCTRREERLAARASRVELAHLDEQERRVQLGAREVVVVEPRAVRRADVVLLLDVVEVERRRGLVLVEQRALLLGGLPVAARLEARPSRSRGRRGPCRAARGPRGTGARRRPPCGPRARAPAGRRGRAPARSSSSRSAACRFCRRCRSRRRRRGAEGRPSARAARRWRGRWGRSAGGAARARSAGARRAAPSATSRAPPAASASAQSHAPQRSVQRTNARVRGPGAPRRHAQGSTRSGAKPGHHGGAEHARGDVVEDDAPAARQRLEPPDGPGLERRRTGGRARSPTSDRRPRDLAHRKHRHEQARHLVDHDDLRVLLAELARDDGRRPDADRRSTTSAATRDARPPLACDEEIERDGAERAQRARAPSARARSRTTSRCVQATCSGAPHAASPGALVSARAPAGAPAVAPGEHRARRTTMTRQ